LPANVISLIVQFWRHHVTPRGLAGAVQVRRKNGETWVTIKTQIPWQPFQKRGHGYEITTEPQVLRTDHFREKAPRDGVAHNKDKKRGRVLYCKQLIDTRKKGGLKRGQIIAALSWHIDPATNAPILITNLAIREDADDARAISRAAAGWMLAYLLEAAQQDGRPSEIGVEIDEHPNRDDFTTIGSNPRRPPERTSRPTGRSRLHRAQRPER